MSWVGGEGALLVLFRWSELTRDTDIKRGLAVLGAGVLSPALLPSLVWPRREVRKGQGGDPGGR